MTENFIENAAPIPWNQHDEPFTIPEFSQIASGDGHLGSVSGEQMSRHWIFNGETGSGKTESGIKPVLRAILRYGTASCSTALPCAALIVDPKHELGELVEQELAWSGRLVHAGCNGRRVDFFEDFRGQQVDIKVLLDQVFDSLVPQNRAGIEKGGDNLYWNSKSKDALYGLAALVAHVESNGGDLGLELLDLNNWNGMTMKPEEIVVLRAVSRIIFNDIDWSPHKSNMREFNLITSFPKYKLMVINKNIEKNSRDRKFLKLIKELKLVLGKQGSQTDDDLKTYLENLKENDVAIEFMANEFWLALGNTGYTHENLKKFAAVAENTLRNEENWFSRIYAILSGILACSIPDEGSSIRERANGGAVADTLDFIARKFGSDHLIPRLSWIRTPDMKTLYWLGDIAQSLIAPLANPEIGKRLCLNPVKSTPDCVPIQECVDNGEVILFQPNHVMTEEDEMLGKALKRIFFRANFSRQNKLRGVAYICDEFQRFVTGDRESGEQSFLDRCRAYRTICVLATQSIASLRYSLQSGSQSMRDSALDNSVTVMLNNIGNKFFFRNTDLGTHALLHSLIPTSPVFAAHAVSVRPISTLKPGECYYLLASGNWGRHQIKLNHYSGNGLQLQPKPTADADEKYDETDCVALT